ncbi:MAG: SagB/ThcOx family dehydrogenase [Albidovulum sp.]
MADMSLREALKSRRTMRAFGDRAVPRDVLDRLLWAAQGMTDAAQNRTAPSAHALHPLRLFVSVGNVDGMGAGLYQVDRDSSDLGLARSGDMRPKLQAAALEDQPWIGAASLVVTICADLVAATTHFASQPPYGERGLRYAYIEAGAAAQNLMLQATADGLGTVLVAGFKDEATSDVLGLTAPLAPVLHICVGWGLSGAA